MVGCDDLKRNAYFFLDGELAEEEKNDIQSHVDACIPCKSRILIHQRFRILIRHRLVAQPASEQLRQRIRAAVRANGSSPTG